MPSLNQLPFGYSYDADHADNSIPGSHYQITSGELNPLDLGETRPVKIYLKANPVRVPIEFQMGNNTPFVNPAKRFVTTDASDHQLLAGDSVSFNPYDYLVNGYSLTDG